MRLFPGLQVSQSAFRLATASVAVLLLAGCSSDSTRLASVGIGGAPTADLTPTASIPSGGPAQQERFNGVQTGSVQSQPLAPISSRPLPAANPSFSAPAARSPQLLQRSASLAPVTTASTVRAAAGWTADGGTPITVAQGETASAIAGRYGIPSDALLRANGLTSAAQVQPGSRLVIPVYNAANAATQPVQAVRAAAAPVVAPARAIAPAAVAKAAPIAAAPAKTHERLQMVQGAVPAADVAKARPAAMPMSEVKPTKPAAIELKATKPAATEVKPLKQVDAKAAADAAAAKQAELDAKKAAADQKKLAADAKKQAADAKKAAALDARKPVDRDTVTASVPPAAAVAPAAAAAPAEDKPEFRWPASGRVIQNFKAGSNDGINISVPEGTSVKAAETGVVAYAGNELKGYGNLVLIRHPNGFVSAYANNGEINVKRGDQVRRGQVIAKSGQSGNVNAPQLHFELRKGSNPVDPTQYLPGAPTASN